jgi:hypothetical protein
MGFLDWYQRDRKLTDYSPGELKREEDRLRIRENQSLSRLEKLEQERDSIFQRGTGPVGSTRRRILARLFEARQRECESLEEDLACLSKEALAVAAIRFRVERKLDGDSSALKKVKTPAIDELAEPWADHETDEEAFAGLLKTALGKVSKGADGDPLKGLGRRAREVIEVWERFDRGELEDMALGLRTAVGDPAGSEEE